MVSNIADSDTYRQHRIGFWGTRYDINLLYWLILRPLFSIWTTFPILMPDITDIDAKIHWPIPIPKF